MRITPLDIQQQRFKKTLKGYDQREVENFLEMVASEIEELFREHHQLKDELRLKEQQIGDFQEREKILKDTLITAQKMTTDIKSNAQKESEIIISQAELQAEKIINMAYQRLAKLIDDINEMKRQRARLESGLKSVLENHSRLLEAMESSRSEEQKPEDTIRVLNKNS